MKINPKNEGLIILTLLVIIGVWMLFVLTNWSSAILVGLVSIIVLLSLARGIYVQKTSHPYCKHCKQPLIATKKTLIGQDERVIRGKFVFFYKYQYEYHCVICHEGTVVQKVHKTASLNQKIN